MTEMKGLPFSAECERMVIGAGLLSADRLTEIAAALKVDDFHLERNQKIFRRMTEILARGGNVDRVTVAHELMRHNELGDDGISYLSEMDSLPHLQNVDSYIEIVAEKSRRRQIAMLSQQAMNRALADDEDSAAILASTEEQLLNLAGRRADQGLMNPMEVIQAYDGGLNSFLDPSRRPHGVATGFARFDEMTNGLRGGQLMILAARPGHGKSSWVRNVAWHVAARARKPVALFSLEMSKDEVLTATICAAGRVDSHRFRAGYLNQDERAKLRKAAQDAAEAPLYIDDSSDLTLMDVEAKLTKLIRKLGEPLGLVVIDYLQLMSSRGRAENRNQEVGAFSRGLKLLSKKLDVPIIALSQLSRAVEARSDKRPMMGDLRDSGNLEADADLIGLLFRAECYKTDREDLKGVAELILAKQRGGSTGVIELVWLAAMTKFESRAMDLGDEVPSEALPYADN